MKITGYVCPSCSGRKTRYAAQCRTCAGDGRAVAAERYGRLAVLGEGPREGRFKHRTLNVRCDCGTEKTVRFAHLRAGRVISCGCAAIQTHTKHGDAARKSGHRTAEYDAWLSMNQRCTNPKNPRWKDYGGRGISVNERWRNSFENFLADMGRRPTAAHSIDRIDNDKGYEPGNCHWATAKEQQQNTRRVSR